MKLAIKLLTILGILLGIAGSFYGFIAMFGQDKRFLAFLFFLLMVVVVVVGVLTIIVVNSNQKPLAVGICCIIFCSLIAGILFLIWEPKEEESAIDVTEKEHVPNDEINYQLYNSLVPSSKVKYLNRLLDKKEITKEKYDSLVAEIK